MRSVNSKMRNIHHCFVIPLVILLAGCVATQPFPYAVRAGDTITLAIGSYDGVNKNNLSITYYPDPGSLPSETPVFTMLFSTPTFGPTTKTIISFTNGKYSSP